MSLLEIVERVRESLERNGRISYRMLKREYALDDDAFEELLEELVEIQRVALREERALAWNSAAAPRATPAPKAAAPAERKPLDYTPRHLADRILQSRSALEGERKLVTVMFADVQGSMELAQALDVEDWHRILDRFFQILTDGVHRFEGTVNQYTGDGIMALFGAPIAHEDHAQRACYTALELRAELRGYADEVRRKHGVSFSTRIGLNSGEVVVGKIGDDLRMDYTAQGHTVGLAQRMEGLAEPGSVFLTEHTARLVEGYFALRGLGGFEIKGSSTPLDVFELEGIGTQRTRLDRSRARGFSRFIGRSREVGTLDGALQRAIAGQGQVVGVVAEAGVGKSRLCVEFLESCRAKGLLVHEAHCPPHGRTVPLLPVFELLRGVFGITEADRDQVAREKIAGRLLLLDREFESQLPLIWEFLGVPDADRPAEALDAGARQRQLYAFIRQQVQARSRREPAVVLIDDLHWVDSASDGFIAQLIEVVQQTRTLLVVNFRPEYRADWMKRSYYQQLALATLGPDDIRALAGELLGTHRSVAELPAAIAARTQGNPFFTEEVVQTLAESGQLEGRRGAYQLKSELRQIQVPATVQAILAARIDRLPEVQKRVLQTAAVIGKEVPESLLRAVIELPDDDLRSALAGLQAAEFLYERSLYPEHEYAFKHPLTHEVAYGSQLAERRKPLHAAVARAIEARDPDRAREHAALLAHHWDSADEPEPAAEWNRLAAIAIGMLDLGDSVRRWERVRELLERVPESQSQLSRGAEARSRLLWFGARGARQLEPEAARRLFEQACELGKRGGNAAAPVDATTSYAQYLLYCVGDIRQSLKLSAQAIAEADRLGDRDLAINARFPAVTASIAEGDYERVLELAGEGLALIAGDPDRCVESMGLSLFTLYHGIRGAAAAYLGRAADAVAEFGRVDTPEGRKHGYSFQALRSAFWTELLWVTGEHRAGLAVIRQAIEVVGNTTPTVHAMSQWSLGIALALVEEWDEADAAFVLSLEVARSARTYLHIEAELLAWLARCAAERGDFERARTLCGQAEAVAERSGARLPRVLVPFARARILSRERGAAAAIEIERELATALSAARGLGARLLEPGIWLERAALAEARGESGERDRYRETARALWIEIGSERNAARIG